MVLQCVHCGKKFFLKLGEQEWLEKHAMRGVRPDRCVECEEYLLRHPTSHALETRGGTIRLHTGERQLMQSWRIPEPAQQLTMPRAKVGAEHATVLLQRFRLGKTTINRLHENIPKGATILPLDSSETLPNGPLSAGTTITIAHMTRNLVYWDAGSNRATIDNPFPGTIQSGSEYSLFRSSDVDGGGLPSPICLDDHNIEKKRRREYKAWRKQHREQQMIPIRVREEQSKLVLDKWGPPCRAQQEHVRAGKQQRSRFNCHVFASAVERFATRGSSLINYPDKRVRTLTLVCYMGLHEGLGAESVLYSLHEDPDLLDLILSMAFPSPSLPQWQLLKPISSAITACVSRPCAIVVADIDDAAVTDHKTRERIAERRRLRSLGMKSNPMSALSRWRRRSGGAHEASSPLAMAHGHSTPQSPASPSSAHAKSPLSERFFGERASVDSPQSQNGVSLKTQVKGMMNLRLNQMTVSHALQREVANRPEQLFVCDDEEGCVKVFLVDGQLDRTIGKGVIRVPGGVVVTSDGTVLVSDVWLHKVHVFDLLGRHVREVGGFGVGLGCFSCPRGMAAGPKGEIFVCDSHNHRIVVMHRSGQAERAFGTQGTAAGCLDEPVSVAVDEEGRVAVAEAGNARVQVFDAAGNSLHLIKNLDWGQDAPPSTFLEADQSGTVEELGMPMGLCFTKEGRLWVTDVYYHRIFLFDADMHPVQKFGAGGGWGPVKAWTEPFRMLRSVGMKHLGGEEHAPCGGNKQEEFSTPTAVGVSSSGRVIVADAGNCRVQVFI